MYVNKIMTPDLYLALKFLKRKKKGKGIGDWRKEGGTLRIKYFKEMAFFKQEKNDPEIHHLVNLSDMLSNLRVPI